MRTDNELLVSEIQKKVGVTDFVSEIKSVENYPDFEKLAHVISHGFQGDDEKTEANDRGDILKKCFCCINKLSVTIFYAKRSPGRGI